MQNVQYAHKIIRIMISMYVGHTIDNTKRQPYLPKEDILLTVKKKLYQTNTLNVTEPQSQNQILDYS